MFNPPISSIPTALDTPLGQRALQSQALSTIENLPTLPGPQNETKIYLPPPPGLSIPRAPETTTGAMIPVVENTELTVESVQRPLMVFRVGIDCKWIL